MAMSLKIATEPAEEPVTLQEAKAHLRINSQTFSEDVSVNQSIRPGSQAIAPSYSLKGAGVDVSAAADAQAVINAGACGSGGTIDAKIQESNTDVDANYTDVSAGAFTQITEANDNQVHTKSYTGTKQYIRIVATVAVAACSFGADVVLNSPSSSEDSLVTAKLTAARIICEGFARRAFITQTWDLFLDSFPGEDEILIPLPPLQSITHLKYKDTAGTLQTFGASYYIVDTNRAPGRIALASGQSWPSTYGEIQDVQIRFVAGYGLAAAVPELTKQAILMRLADFYSNRGEGPVDKLVDQRIENLLWMERDLRI